MDVFDKSLLKPELTTGSKKLYLCMSFLIIVTETGIMSDGNFNRALLPKNELSAGLRAGKTQMRVKAEAAFDVVLETFLQGETDERKAEMKKRFMDMLRA